MNRLRQAAADYLAVRRALGFKLRGHDRLLADYLATADVCISPDPKSPVNDLCSMNKIVEYMAMGKPVVAFDLKEAQETALALLELAQEQHNVGDLMVAYAFRGQLSLLQDEVEEASGSIHLT